MKGKLCSKLESIFLCSFFHGRQASQKKTPTSNLGRRGKLKIIDLNTRGTQNHEKQRFSPPKTWFLGTKNMVFDGFRFPRQVVFFPRFFTLLARMQPGTFELPKEGLSGV